MIDTHNLRSGQTFKHLIKGTFWKLQKLPDFDAWILIGIDEKPPQQRKFESDPPDREIEFWCSPEDKPLRAFGGLFTNFERVDTMEEICQALEKIGETFQ